MEKVRMTRELRELIRLLVRHLGMLDKLEAGCCGVSIGQCHAIVEIGRAGEISLNELAELLNLDNSTMSRTVNGLVEQGYVFREADAEDRRYIKIRLTEKGMESFNAIETGMESYFGGVLDAIPEEKQQQVLESMRLLDEAVKRNKCC